MSDMNRHVRVSVCTVAAVIVVALMRPISLLGQTPAAATPALAPKDAKTLSPPRTLWGDPDLQGVFMPARIYLTYRLNIRRPILPLGVFRSASLSAARNVRLTGPC